MKSKSSPLCLGSTLHNILSSSSPYCLYCRKNKLVHVPCACMTLPYLHVFAYDFPCISHALLCFPQPKLYPPSSHVNPSTVSIAQLQCFFGQRGDTDDCNVIIMFRFILQKELFYFYCFIEQLEIKFIFLVSYVEIYF